MSICLLIFERERERERNINVRNFNRVPSGYASTRDGTHNLGMCPDWELNPQPFGVWGGAPSN